MLGVAALLVSPYGLKHLTLVRTDALFAALIAVGAIAGHRAWIRGGPWLLFWVIGTLSTLTKGPLGVALAASGLLAGFREKGAGGRRVKAESGGAWRGHVAGVSTLLLVCGLWMALAYRSLGEPFLDTLIGRELVGHMVSRPKGDGFPGSEFYQPTAYLVSRFAPWCVPAALGLWRVFRRPAPDEQRRRSERFVAFWFVGGMALFSLSPHQRPDLLMPILAPAAMLAGMELARWFAGGSPRRVMIVAGLIGLVGVCAAAGRERFIRGRDPEAAKTAELRELAGRIEARYGRSPLMIDIDANPVLQVFLNTMNQRVSLDEAAEILTALADPSAFAATTRPGALIEALRTRGAAALVIDETRRAGPQRVSIVGMAPAMPER